MICIRPNSTCTASRTPQRGRVDPGGRTESYGASCITSCPRSRDFVTCRSKPTCNNNSIGSEERTKQSKESRSIRYLVSSLPRAKVALLFRFDASKKQSEKQPPVDVGEGTVSVLIQSECVGGGGGGNKHIFSLFLHWQLFPYGCKLFEWPHLPPQLWRGAARRRRWR